MSPGATGLNRAHVGSALRSPQLIALRTTPPENPHILEEPRFRGQDSRPITHWGAAQAEVGPVVAPGKYTMRLTVDGESYTQPLEIVQDPSSTGSDADIRSQVKLQLRIRDDINSASDMVNQIEWMRKQLDDVQKMLRADKRQSRAVEVRAGHGSEDARRGIQAGVEGSHHQRRQIFHRGVQDLFQPDLAERRSGHGRGRRRGRRGLSSPPTRRSA